jgi:hypothetical protein
MDGWLTIIKRKVEGIYEEEDSWIEEVRVDGSCLHPRLDGSIVYFLLLNVEMFCGG